MNVLVITTDNSLLPKYTINGPMTIDEAVALTREASLVIVLADSAAAKANQKQVDRLYSCVANSPVICRSEKQVKTMEYVLGGLLSELTSPELFPEPVRITQNSYAINEVKRLFHKIPEPLAVAHIDDLADIYVKTHKKNLVLEKLDEKNS